MTKVRKKMTKKQKKRKYQNEMNKTHVNRSVNVYFSENLVTLLMTLCPPRVLKNFDDDQVLCVRHDKIRCFLWSRTLELAGPIDIMNEKIFIFIPNIFLIQ